MKHNIYFFPIHEETLIPAGWTKKLLAVYVTHKQMLRACVMVLSPS